jgi:hypothetical protein
MYYPAGHSHGRVRTAVVAVLVVGAIFSFGLGQALGHRSIGAQQRTIARSTMHQQASAASALSRQAPTVSLPEPVPAPVATSQSDSDNSVNKHEQGGHDKKHGGSQDSPNGGAGGTENGGGG